MRAAHKQGWFEVIAGKTVVAFRRTEEREIPADKCFGFVQTYDDKPRRRLWELLKSQGMQENQQIVFMSDGGENVRRVQEYLHPFSEHLIDWFHITMRLTVLQSRYQITALGAAESEDLRRKQPVSSRSRCLSRSWENLIRPGIVNPNAFERSLLQAFRECAPDHRRFFIFKDDVRNV